MADPDFGSVAFLCHFDGEDAATASVDESNTGHTLVFQNGAELDTAVKKFGTASLKLVRSGGDEVTVVDHADFTVGTNFTAECFFRLASIPPGDSFSDRFVALSQYESGGGVNQIAWAIIVGSANIRVAGSANGSSFYTTVIGAWTPDTTNQHHVAWVKEGSTSSLYLNGSRLSQQTWGAIHNSTTDFRIGALSNPSGDEHFNGWIDEARLSHVARYTGPTYTVPTAAFEHGETAGAVAAQSQGLLLGLRLGLSIALMLVL